MDMSEVADPVGISVNLSDYSKDLLSCEIDLSDAGNFARLLLEKLQCNILVEVLYMLVPLVTI